MVAFEGLAGDGGDGHISHTMDQSVDLANSSHYDGNDASKCFTIWTEDIPGPTEGWHFVLPNVHGKRAGGGLFDGLAIRLTHGVLISWDGRLVRYGTSVMDRKGHVYGTFYAAKKAIVEHGQRMSAESANKKRKETTSCHNTTLVVVAVVVGHHLTSRMVTHLPARGKQLGGWGRRPQSSRGRGTML
jgi:hypothetical protein